MSRVLINLTVSTFLPQIYQLHTSWYSMWLLKIIMHIILCNRLRKIVLHFKLTTYFVRHIIDDYNPVNATTFFSIIFESDLYSGTSVRTNLKTTLRRRRDDNSCVRFRSNVTIMDIIVFIILITSSLTYLLSFYLSFKLSKVSIWILILQHIVAKLVPSQDVE